VLIVIVPGAPVLVGMTFVYGFCLGQITTLSPIIVRREFGAASFGTVYGVAGTVIPLSLAFGPALYGLARDLLGSYPPVLAIVAGFELAALATILAGFTRSRNTG
jgi:cyanate permease